MEDSQLPHEAIPLLVSEKRFANYGSQQQRKDGLLARATTDRIILAGMYGSVVLAIVMSLFLDASIILAGHGRSHYGLVEGRDMSRLQTRVGLASPVAVVFVTANFIAHDRRGRLLPNLVNILGTAILGTFSVVTSVSAMADRAGSEHDVTRHCGIGDRSACRRWAVAHEATVWAYLVVLSVYGILQGAILIAAVLEARRLGRESPSNLGSSLGDSILARVLSIEECRYVSVKYGHVGSGLEAGKEELPV